MLYQSCYIFIVIFFRDTTQTRVHWFLVHLSTTMSGVVQFFYEAGQRYYALAHLSEECHPHGDPPTADLIIDYKKCNLPFVFVNHGTLVLLIIVISILLREFKLIEKALYLIPGSVIVLLFGLIVGFLYCCEDQSLLIAICRY